MRIVRNYSDLSENDRGAAVALGNFDGVHLGHQTVIREMIAIADSQGISSAAMTFNPHPRKFFQPDAPLFEMTPAYAKSRHIETLGLDLHYVMPFDQEFSALEASTFIETVLVKGLGVRHIVAGYDFVFGKGRKGDVTLLAEGGKEHGFGVTITSAVTAENGTPYSSTVIREHIREGRPREAADLLGRAWEIEGEVMTGDQRGRQIGFPTANVDPGTYIMPALGVYAVWAGITDGPDTEWHKAVVNVGRRPTFDGEGITVETHLFDFEGDLYGKVLRVAFVDFIRPEMKFDGFEEIKAQIAADCVKSREILDAAAPGDITTPTQLNSTGA
ncbi:MAG: riboflavin biosynthesis protein RibF [Rhodospirillaceae bacterium]|nr:riboflavin biosynthesis protein RibF [Rhodospirillaceae bacterium]|tara:strand:+ start:57355 stop:58344 length:990 start_codon:yes stop_codon:yes gene_type:complete